MKKLLFFVLLFYGISANPECFFPESEVRPFFYEVPSSTPGGTTVADSLVDPPNAIIKLASIRSNNLPQVNFTERFTLTSEPNGRFKLLSTFPLNLPSYPSIVTESLLYVTIVCNGKPFPLMTIRLKAANTVAPSFLNEPYVVEVDDTLTIGREIETPISVVDWDPATVYDVKLKLEKNPSFELASYPGGPPDGIEDVRSWSKMQYPLQHTLRLIGPVTYPIDLKLKATDNGNPTHVTISSIRLTKRVRNPTVFSRCYISTKLRENATNGTRVATIPIENYNEETQLELVDPDGTFSIKGDELFVADPKLIDRELFTSLEVVIDNKNATSDAQCKRLRIRVELEDENDNRPVFERESYWFHLDESIAPGTEFAILKARDVDDAENGRVTYDLLNQTLPFRIYPRGRDSILATTGPLGNEEQYNLVIEASDHGLPPKVTQVEVDVFIVRPGRPVKEVEIKKQLKKIDKSTVTQPAVTPETSTVTSSKATTHLPPVVISFPTKDDLINRAIDEATKEFQELVNSPENPQNANKPIYTTSTQSPEEVRIQAVLLQTKKKLKEPVALRGVAQVPGRPRVHLEGLVPATSTTEGPESENNGLEEKEEAEERSEDLGEADEKQPFGFTADHYYYEVFGQPVEDDVFGRVVAEPNPQMYGLDRQVAGIFKVDTDIGELAVGRRLYLHQPGNISFTVSSTDGRSTARAVITVLFEPDKEPKESRPQFDQTLYKFRVVEQNPSEVIGIVRAFHTTASSRSSPNQLKYSIDGPNLPFSIHQVSGEIANEEPLDRENHSTYRFNVRACLSSSPEICGTSEVEVSVGDINDHAPRFTSSLLHVTLPSDAPINTEVTQVRAIDEDGGENGAISYILDVPSDYFAVDSETGRVVTISPLKDSKYTLLIQATDHGNPPKSDATEVRIKVIGTNPSAPAFDQRQYQVIVTPPTPAGAIIAQVQATDPDPGPEGLVKYRFSRTEDAVERKTQERFEINAKTGVVSSIQPLRTGEGPFDLMVEAYDGSSSFSRKTSALLHIEVGSEAAIRFLPLPATVYISTEKAVGSVILRASASTTSSSPVHFRVIEEGTQFEMDGDLLRVVTHILPGKTVITIRAETDSIFTDHKLTVVTMDNSDKYPVFPQLTFDIDVPKEATFPQVVARFSARVRNGTVSYELHPETPPFLALNSRTGELTIKSADFVPTGAETNFIVVRARNAFFPDFFSDVGVALNRIEQKAEIRFGQAVYRLEVVENTPIGSLVSHPLDVFPRTLSVNFRLSPSDSFFGIHPNGTVFVTKPIDLEQIGTPVLQFTVWAETDNGQQASSRLNVDLKDENEFSPEVAKAFIEGRVKEDAAPGTPVAKVDANDKDFTEGKHLLYRIIGGTGKDLVFIQEDGTIILGDAPIDREHMPTFDVQIEIYDKNGNKASAMALITVDDVNDNAPIIKNQPLKWIVKENDPSSTFKIEASDGDHGTNGDMTFKILRGNGLGHFKIEDNRKGEAILRIARPLDFEEQKSFTLTLEAKDAGSPPKTTNFPIEITVQNDNDNAPIFAQKSVSQKIPVDSPIGLPLLSLTASDVDGDSVKYSLSGADCDSLSIDPLGVISWKSPPAKRPIKKLICQVTASDGVHVSSSNLNLDVFSEVQPTTVQPNRAPVFEQKEYIFTAEGPRGTRIGRVVASDPDGDQVLFAIKPSEYRNLFDIDHQGYLSLKQDAIELSQSQYSFLISAEDWGPPIMTTVVNVKVVVPIKVSANVDGGSTTSELEEVTTERPKDIPIVEGEHLGPDQGVQGVQPIVKFIRPVYVYSIKGDSPIGSYLGQVHVTFNKGVKFELEGDGSFKIDDEGRIRTSQPLKEGKFNQTVIAFKNGEEIASVPMIVHIIGVATSPGIAPSSRPVTTTTTSKATAPPTTATQAPETRKPLTFAFERPMYFAFVAEGKYTGLKLPIKPDPLATTTDGKVSFSIANKTDPLPFYLTENGELICFDVDREQKANYVVEILAQHQGEVAKSVLNVTVLDVNDNYPLFVEEQEETIGLASDAVVGGTVKTFKATDLDAGTSGQVVYDISGEAARYLTIDHNLGVLTISSALSSAPHELPLTVIASDQGRPSMKSRLEATILVFDAHSPAPLLPRLKENLLVPHDALPGYLIKTLLAGPTVPSTSTLEPIEYGLTDDYYGLFKIENGKLSLAREPFPMESGRLHQLNVTAKNSLGTDSTLVNVLLQADEDNSQTTTQSVSSTSPDNGNCRFTKNVYQVDVMENQPQGVHVATVKADCANPIYVLDEENEDFSIDAYGQLSTKRPLDRETKSLHLIYINVNPTRVVRSDPIVESAKQHLQSNQAVVIVRVLDENDNSPYFEHLVNGRLVAHVDWKAKAHSPVMRISARDKDSSPHLVYSLPESALFSIDANTGVLSLKTSLEEEGREQFDIVATVDDGVHQASVPITIFKLSPETNVVRLTSDLPPSRVREYQVERTLNELTGSDSRVMAKGSIDGNKSSIYVYAVDPETKEPIDKERLVQMLSAQKTALMASPSRISDVSIAPNPPTTLSVIHVLLLLLVLLLVIILLCLTLWCAHYCKRRRYATSVSDREYMFSTGGPRPYDVEAITRQTAQTVLAQVTLPSPMTTHRDPAISPAFADRSESVKDFGNSVRERPGLLQSALQRHKIQPGVGSLSAVVVEK